VEGRPLRSAAGDTRGVAPPDADISEFVVAKLRELPNDFAVTPPGDDLFGDGIKQGQVSLPP